MQPHASPGLQCLLCTESNKTGVVCARPHVKETVNERASLSTRKGREEDLISHVLTSSCPATGSSASEDARSGVATRARRSVEEAGVFASIRRDLHLPQAALVASEGAAVTT